MLLTLTVCLFEEIRGNVKKYILQTLSQGIKEYWHMIYKYDKPVITVMEWNWKCCTQFKKFLLYRTSTHPAVSVILSVLGSALEYWKAAVIPL